MSFIMNLITQGGLVLLGSTAVYNLTAIQL